MPFTANCEKQKLFNDEMNVGNLNVENSAITVNTCINTG